MKNFVTIRSPVRIASVTCRMHKETQAVSTSSKSIRIGLCYKDGLGLTKVILRSRAGWRRNVGPRQPRSGRIDSNVSGSQEKTARERRETIACRASRGSFRYRRTGLRERQQPLRSDATFTSRYRRISRSRESLGNSLSSTCMRAPNRSARSHALPEQLPQRGFPKAWSWS